ncbi:HNH endonuclease, partial [Bradyrhizobium japonicum]|uniref:HNH endonuclease n=1 Tax=Bradyrhizobium japonicum TaxID=375 RepID=UPI00057665A5
ETGKLVRKFRSGEKGAGFLSGDYLRVSINHKIYLVHRLVWKMVTGEEPVGYIDHIDGNRFNNAWANLRDVTHDQNMWNAKLFHNNTSGYRGVSFIQSHGMWRAAISVNGKKKHIGYFDTAEAAHVAFVAASAEVRDEYARVA